MDYLRRIGRKLAIALTVLALVAAGAALVSAALNLRLPLERSADDRLGNLDKARVAEALHLRRAFGDEVWPGWREAAIPIEQANAAYRFLIAHRSPPDDWELVPDDDVAGQPYYRLAYDPETVQPDDLPRVGDQLTASLVVKGLMDSHLIRQFQRSVPLPFRPFFPYRVLIQSTEVYLAALVNNAMAVHLAQVAPGRVSRARIAQGSIGSYPFGRQAQRELWPTEVDLLIRAIEAQSRDDALALTRQFLATREWRRDAAELDAWMVHVERETEWLTGLPMYTELRLWQLAAQTGDYVPHAALVSDPDFHLYRNFEEHWMETLGVVRSCADRDCVMRLQYSGMLQAFLLERLSADWREMAIGDDVFLEDLLRQGVSER